MLKCKHITFVITKKCNANCPICYVDQDESYFDFEMLKSLLVQLVNLGGRSVGFSGGEPLLYPHIFEIISYAKNCGLETSLVSNGIGFTDALTRKLKENGLDRVQFSLDAGNQHENDLLRWPGCFDAVTNKAIPAALHQKMKVTLVAVPNFYIVTHIEEYLELAKKLEVNAVYFRRRIDKYGKESIDKDMYWDFLNTISMAKNRYGFSIYSGDPLQSIVMAEKLNKNYENMLSGCSAGITSLAIVPNGEVYPCTRLPVTVGNIFKQSLENIWKESNILKNLRFRQLEGVCGSCRNKYICGGCRASSYYIHSNYLQQDDMCKMIK